MMCDEASKLGLFWFRAFECLTQITKELFAYERTSPILERGKQGPFCILRRTVVSSLGSDSATADCWLWLYGARFRKIVEGARKLRRHPACAERPGASFHGMAYHFDRARRRPRRIARSFRPPGQPADGGASLRSDFHRPPALWVQLDQAAGCDGGARPVRAAGV